MRVPFVDVRSQYQELAQTIDSTVHEIIETGAYVLGKHNKGLEAEIAQYHGVKYGIAVNSGTDALRIMLDAANIGPGDEVITTAFTFVASVEVILQCGAKPVYADIDPDTYQIDPAKIEEKITSRTKAIMPVHLFGQLVDVKAIGDICKKHNLVMLEDAAQAIGSHNNGVFAGNYGIAAGLSFYVTKNLGAAGDAGMILTNDEAYADKCRAIRVHGMGRERYYYDYIGYTSRMDEIQAAILRIKYTRLDAWNARRDELSKIYYKKLADCGIALPKIIDGNNHSWHQFSIRTNHRDELQSFLKEREIDSMIYYPVPLHYHEPYKDPAFPKGSLPKTEMVSDQILSLPIQQHLSNKQIEFVADSILEFSKTHDLTPLG